MLLKALCVISVPLIVQGTKLPFTTPLLIWWRGFMMTMFWSYSISSICHLTNTCHWQSAAGGWLVPLIFNFFGDRWRICVKFQRHLFRWPQSGAAVAGWLRWRSNLTFTLTPSITLGGCYGHTLLTVTLHAWCKVPTINCPHVCFICITQGLNTCLTSCLGCFTIKIWLFVRTECFITCWSTTIWQQVFVNKWAVHITGMRLNSVITHTCSVHLCVLSFVHFTLCLHTPRLGQVLLFNSARVILRLDRVHSQYTLPRQKVLINNCGQWVGFPVLLIQGKRSDVDKWLDKARNGHTELLTQFFHDGVHVGADSEVALLVMLGGLQVDDHQLASGPLGQQRDVAAGDDLQGGAQANTQVSFPANTNRKSKTDSDDSDCPRSSLLHLFTGHTVLYCTSSQAILYYTAPSQATAHFTAPLHRPYCTILHLFTGHIVLYCTSSQAILCYTALLHRPYCAILHLLTGHTVLYCTSSQAILYYTAPLHRPHCTILHLFTDHTVLYCTSSQAILSYTAPLHRPYCTILHLFTGHTVLYCTSSQAILYYTAPLHRPYCTILHLFTGHTVLYCTSSQAILYYTAPLHRPYCTILHLFTGHTVLYCTSSPAILYYTAPLHRPYCTILHLFTGHTVLYCTSSPAILYYTAPLHRPYCTILHLFTGHTVLYCTSSQAILHYTAPLHRPHCTILHLFTGHTVLYCTSSQAIYFLTTVNLQGPHRSA